MKHVTIFWYRNMKIETEFIKMILPYNEKDINYLSYNWAIGTKYRTIQNKITSARDIVQD